MRTRIIVVSAVLLFSSCDDNNKNSVPGSEVDNDASVPEVDDSANMTITVSPKNDASDFESLQSAVDNVPEGGIVKLTSGTFFLGDGNRSPKKTVRISKGMTIQGEMDGQDWKTVIEGGGEMAEWGIFGVEMESGPFRIENFDDEHPVVFENLRLSKWTAEAIYIEAARGFTIRQCRIDTPLLGTAVVGIRSVHAVFSAGPYAKGAFLAENNLVELGDYPDGLPDDEQSIGLFFSYHDSITIVNNQISGVDEGIEVLGNSFDLSQFEYYADYPAPGNPPSEIIISDNKIDVTQIPETVWPGKFAILVAGNANTSSVLIENNEVTISGEESGYGFALSGENLHVKNNTLHLETKDDVKPGGALLIGFGFMIYPIIPELNGGPSLINSVIENNTFKGAARGPSVYFHDPSQQYENLDELFPGNAPNQSHGNQIHMDDIVGLGAETTIAITPGVYDNTFIGNTGNVMDLSPEDANQY